MTGVVADPWGRVEARRRRWLVTGVAGFIGSHLLESLLGLDQEVVGLDDFSTGRRENLDDVRARVGEDAWQRFALHEADVTDLAACRSAVAGADLVLHQAALGSVPRSVADPLRTNLANVNGFLNVLVAARDEGVDRFVYAASSSTYGDHAELPKVEDRIGRPLSPYAVSKYVDELYADVFSRTYGVPCVGLRYFNVFGPRQDPGGAYAAVIPKWIGRLLRGESCKIHGDGRTSRDFCYVANAVQANLRAAMADQEGAEHQVYNVAVGESTTLDELFAMIRDGLAERTGRTAITDARPEYGPFRPGDVRHSLADVSKARNQLGYEPSHTVREGLAATLDWFVGRARERGAA